MSSSTSASAGPRTNPRIDPRIRARRVAVQRDEGRRRLRRLLVAAGVAATMAGLWAVALTPVLDVDHIVVTGAAHSGEAVVQAATGVQRGDPLVTARLGRAAHRVAALPWVQSVDVRRGWPGTVHVEVVEHTAAAAVPARTGGWILLDADGRQLAVGPDPGQGILHVEVRALAPHLGADVGDGSGEGIGATLRLAASVPVALRDRLLSLRPAPGGEVEGRVILRDGGKATILLGRPTQAAAKWLALLSVLDDTDPARLDRIDVRVPSAPALTRH